MSVAPPNDKPAAFIGMIATAVLLFAMCVVIVKWTNTRFAAHASAPAAKTAH